MRTKHTEKAFEDAIENYLVTIGGYTKGDPKSFDQKRGLDPGLLVSFVQETQPDLWNSLEKLHGADTEAIVLDDLCKTMNSQGCLNVLRHGFKCFGKLVRVAYFAPAHGMNPETERLYKANRLTVTRQLHYSKDYGNSIDMVLSLNGLPIATAELKNRMTGQSVEHAKSQYMTDRDPKEIIFRFTKRALVHFAVDPDEVHMTTRLQGRETVFLPFNRGDGTGAGNPENPCGYQTAYLWEEVLAKDSLMDILSRFLHLQVQEARINGKKTRKESMVFPRYHQLTSVRELEADARQVGAGQNYLIQHSAGSGKSNSIGWLAYRLSSLHDEQDNRVFDSVVVVTDRLVLDNQIQDTIYQFEHVHGVVEKIDVDSAQLAAALAAGTPIIITTLQKFPFVTKKIGDLPHRRYAVIVDEAHSSQSGESATDLKGVLAGADLKAEAKETAEEQGLPDHEEEILKAMAKRGHQPNLSFFAFTATPKYKTLEVFGRPGPDGKPVPFHLYSMRQAIEEEFILDVLKHYTTYKTYYRLIKSIEDDPRVDKRKAAKGLARFTALHPHNVAQKTEVMIEHFRASTRHKIGGQAKAMVVTGSRIQAVRYKQSFDKYIGEKGYEGINTLVAFSGTVVDDIGKAYTEVAMNNGIRETELPAKFATGDYQVLIAADKFQTGFDQPLLHTMYVDKRLSGVQAVQTLSRLNRKPPGKEDTFVLDFFNDPQEICASFQPYYEQTSVGEQVDHHQLYELQARADEYHVYHQDEVEDFCKVYFKPNATPTSSDNGLMNAILDRAVARFKKLDESSQDEFRKLLSAFRNLYSFLAQVIPFQDSDLEKLYTYTRFLLRKLPKRGEGLAYEFDDEVTLKYYRLQKISEGSISLQAGEPGEVSGPTDVGTGLDQEEKIELSQLIDLINERFGTSFTQTDELFFEQIRKEATDDPKLQQAAKVNTMQNFKYEFDKALQGYFLNRLGKNEAIVARFLDNKEFRELVAGKLLDDVYNHIRQQDATQSAQ